MSLGLIDYTFSYSTFIFLFVFTFGLFYLVAQKIENKFKRYFIYTFCLSFFVYSGLGTAILDDNGRYLFYYLVYCLTLVLSIFLFRNKTIRFKMEDEMISSFIDRKANVFIVIYIFIAFIQLLLPENKLHFLLSPPSIDITGVMDIVTREEANDMFTSITMLVKNIIFPFFFLSLTKYAKQPIKLLFLILMPLYFGFCKDGYIARSVFGLYFLFYMAILYYYNYEKRKIILVSTISIVLLSISFLATFTYLRVGEKVDLSLSESINSLFIVEGTFPLWFEDIYNHSLSAESHIVEYVLWIITQPFPGFMKSWLVDLYLNISIAQVLLGLDPDEIVSYVPLVGLVGESVFVFGSKLFFLHAIILGYIINIFLNIIVSKNSFKIIAIYAIVFTALGLGRAGTASSDSYAYMIKTMVYLPILLYIFNLKLKPDNN